METGNPREPSKLPAPVIYPSSGIGATPLFEQILRPLIEKEGPLPFPRFMELALYHEEHGYYSDPERVRVGRGGDFATNISVGETFGRLLALRLHEFWIAHRSPAVLHIFELGPEDGSLALDILKWAHQLSPDFRASLRYTACEHSTRKRAILATRFAQSAEPHLQASDTSREHRGEFGVVLANEVLDALPVKLLRFTGGSWHQRWVDLDQDGALTWSDLIEDDPHTLAFLGDDFTNGYQTELCGGYPLFQDLARLFDRGLFLFIDYGFTHQDYYHPDRTEGTLQTYCAHQAGDDPLDSPGLRDITTHVNFTAAAASARLAALRLHGFARQESYLTNLAAPLLRTLPDGPASLSFIRQFRTLTHPGFFGSRFHVLELTQGALDPSFRFPCASQDLAAG